MKAQMKALADSGYKKTILPDDLYEYLAWRNTSAKACDAYLMIPIKNSLPSWWTEMKNMGLKACIYYDNLN